jgi:hypothetical protein
MTPTAQIAPAAETAPLSDEAILGIEAESGSAARGSDSQSAGDTIEAEFASRDTAPGAENRARSDERGSEDDEAGHDRAAKQRADENARDAEQRDDENAADTEQRDADKQADANRDANAERTLPLTSLAEFDAGFYSGDAASRTALAQSLFASDPGAFRAMFDEAARLLGVSSARGGDAKDGGLKASATQSDRGMRDEDDASRGNARASNGQAPNDPRDADLQGPTRTLVQDATQSNAPLGNANSGNESRTAIRADRDAQTGAANAANSQGTSAAQGSFPAESYRAFENSTNEAVAREVRGAITRTLEQVLPEGVAAGAAKRIGEDIFGEVGKLLAADAQLSSQVGESLRGWRFGAAEQQQVASLLSGRARQILPSVARRVIGEWTNSVLSTARTRATRSEAAARRVDVGAAASGDAAGRGAARALRPREIDYARTSDDDIFAM